MRCSGFWRQGLARPVLVLPPHSFLRWQGRPEAAADSKETFRGNISRATDPLYGPASAQQPRAEGK